MQPVYLVKSNNTNFSEVKRLNSIMNKSNELVCWKNRSGAETYIQDHHLENNFFVSESTLERIEEDVRQVNEEYSLDIKVLLV